MARRKPKQIRREQEAKQPPSQDTSHWTGGGIGTSKLVPEIMSAMVIR